MTVPEAQSQVIEAKVDNKEVNFRKQQQMYERMLAEKEARVKELEQAALQKQQPKHDDDDDDDEPYIDKRKLAKTLSKHEERVKQDTQTEIQRAVSHALLEEKKKQYLDRNPDFYDVIEKGAEKLAQHNPELAETILKMPDPFERHKLAYQNIKAFGLHQDKPKESSIQDKVDANRRTPFLSTDRGRDISIFTSR